MFPLVLGKFNTDELSAVIFLEECHDVTLDCWVVVVPASSLRRARRDFIQTFFE